jgi:hypothetical protein
MTAKPTAPERLDRIERGLAQVATAMRQCVGWHPGHNGQREWQEILDEQREQIALERRPAPQAPERRDKATV